MSESHVENPLRIFFFAMTSVAFFSVMNILVKLVSTEAATVQVVFFRNLIAFIPILILVKYQGGWHLLKTADPLGHFWRGMVGVAAMGCFFVSFALLPMANATALHFVSPLLLTILSIPLLGEKVGKVRWFAVILGFIGVYIMVRPETSDGNILGTSIAFAAAFLAAFAMIFVRKLGRTEHALTIVFYFTVYGTLLSGIAMVFFWQDITAYAMLLMFGVGLLGGVGQIFLTNAYAQAPAAFVAPFNYVAIIFAVIADVMIWGKWPEWQIYVGSIIIVCSGLIIVYREAKKKKALNVRTNIYSLQPTRPTEADREEK